MGREPSLSLGTGVERTTEMTDVNSRAQRAEGRMSNDESCSPCSSIWEVVFETSPLYV